MSCVRGTPESISDQPCKIATASESPLFLEGTANTASRKLPGIESFSTMGLLIPDVGYLSLSKATGFGPDHGE